MSRARGLKKVPRVGRVGTKGNEGQKPEIFMINKNITSNIIGTYL